MIHPEKFLPQGEAVAAVLRQARHGGMTHALMITGEKGLGKWTLAKGLTAALLCENPQEDHRPCGRCRACAQTETLSHPDLIVIEKGAPLVPTDTKTVIPVSDIQEMVRRVSLQGYEGDRHIVMIHQAEDMNDAAQNKLLKTLEEPPEGTYFLLTCENQEQVLPTIVSRCRPLKLHAWAEREVLQALSEHEIPEGKAQEAAREAGGSIGRALQIAGDEAYWAFRADVIRDFLGCEKRSEILPISNRWKDRKDEAERLFSILENIFGRMSRISLGLGMGTIPDCPMRWADFVREAGAEEYVRLYDAISLARKRVRSSVNFQAAIEQLILSLMEAVISR